MKNSAKKYVQSSELFCKVQTSCNVKPLIHKGNVPKKLCSLQAEKTSLQSSKTLSHQLVKPNSTVHCKHPPGLHQGGSKSPLVLNRVSATCQVVHRIDFARRPEIGTVLMLEGQRYLLVDWSPHTRADGQPTILLHWESHCPDCGAAFILKTGLKAGAINRRCEKHHRMGVPVAKGKKAWQGGAK